MPGLTRRYQDPSNNDGALQKGGGWHVLYTDLWLIFAMSSFGGTKTNSSPGGLTYPCKNDR